MTEADLMLLEDYLDNEMSAADARAIEERCVHELALASELNRLKADRAVRVQVWRTMEGNDGAVERVANRVAATISHRESHVFLLHGLRIGAAAAACIVIGLTAGFFAKSSNPVNAPRTAVAVKTTPDPDAIRMTQQLAQGYDVRLTDPNGKVVAVQHFANADQARQFAQDVGQWQQKEEQMHNGNVSLVADQY